jgi:hypothetical protein
MIKRGNKRGSHVDVIISFIIFVTFIFFLLAIIKPAMSTQTDKKNIFDNVELGITNKTSSDMTIITATLGSGGNNCVSLNNLISDAGIGNNIIVKDALGRTVSSEIGGNSLQITRTSTNDTFFKIYYSEEFDELGTGSGCSSANYALGFTKTSKYIFEKKVLELIAENHETLKKELKVQEGVNFGYGIVLSNGTSLETNEENLSTNVYIRETPVEYVDLEGNILEGYLKTKIW